MISLVLAVSFVPAVPVSRSEVVARAAAFVHHEWVVSEANQSASCASSYESDYEVGAQAGVPYAWGGFMDLGEFDQRIDDGDGAGSHSWHGVLSCVAGVDCSGLISHAWKLPKKHGTSTLDQVSEPVDLEEVRPGDAFNKPGKHVVLYIGESSAGEPLFYEAAGSSGVRQHSGWSYLDGYLPIRFAEIVDDSVAALPEGGAEPASEPSPATGGDTPEPSPDPCAGLRGPRLQRCRGRASPGTQPTSEVDPPSGEPAAVSDPPREKPPKETGCGCSSAGESAAIAGGSGAILGLLLLVTGRRRR